MSDFIPSDYPIISWSESESNIGIAIDAMCDYEVATSRIRWLHQIDAFDHADVAKAGKLVAISSLLIANTFTAFGLETWLNRIAATVLPSKNKVKKWDGNAARSKYSELLKAMQMAPPRNDLQARIDQLFGYRNQVVHDKSRILFASEDSMDFRTGWDDSLEPKECLQSLADVEEDFMLRAPHLEDIVRMTVVYARDSKTRLRTSRIRVGSTLPFFGGEFPDPHQYRLFYRRRLENHCPPIVIDPRSGLLEQG